MIEIKKLAATDGEDIYNMLQEMPREENGFVNNANGLTFDDYKTWLEKAAKNSEQVGLVDGWKVPETVFWLYDNGDPVGIGKIRHFLTDALKVAGGNIGYAVRPTKRGRGYGKMLAKMLVDEARKMGVSEILITVHEDNIPSLRAALATGGEFTKTENGRHYIWVQRN